MVRLPLLRPDRDPAVLQEVDSPDAQDDSLLLCTELRQLMLIRFSQTNLIHHGVVAQTVVLQTQERKLLRKEPPSAVVPQGPQSVTHTKLQGENGGRGKCFQSSLVSDWLFVYIMFTFGVISNRNVYLYKLFKHNCIYIYLYYYLHFNVCK